MKDELYYISQKSDLNQKNLKKQIIGELKQQREDNNKRFELLEQLIFESVSHKRLLIVYRIRA